MYKWSITFASCSRFRLSVTDFSNATNEKVGRNEFPRDEEKVKGRVCYGPGFPSASNREARAWLSWPRREKVERRWQNLAGCRSTSLVKSRGSCRRDVASCSIEKHKGVVVRWKWRPRGRATVKHGGPVCSRSFLFRAPASLVARKSERCVMFGHLRETPRRFLDTALLTSSKTFSLHQNQTLRPFQFFSHFPSLFSLSLCSPCQHAARWRRVSCVCESYKAWGVSRCLIYDSVEHRREGLDDISWIFGMCEWRRIFLASRTSLRSLFSVQLANRSLLGREQRRLTG